MPGWTCPKCNKGKIGPPDFKCSVCGYQDQDDTDNVVPSEKESEEKEKPEG